MATNLPEPRAIAAIAARQHGNVTRRQLLDLGLGPAAIAYRVRAGDLYRVHPGVYAVGRPPRLPLERAAAALLACGPRAALSHRSAMALWGLWKRWEFPLHVTIPAGDRRPKGITVHRPTTLTGRDLTTQLGIRVTSPARTMLDVAASLPDAQFKRTVNDALYSNYLQPNDLAELVARSEGHPGAKRLAWFVDTDDGPTRATWEDDFPAFCEHFGLPRPRLAARIGRYTTDALFEDHKVIVELDGWGSHRSRSEFESNRDRDADNLAAGHPTIRITKDRLTRTPAREAQRLHQILEWAKRLGGDSRAGPAPLRQARSPRAR